jgi:hypothetical protein
VILTWCAVAGFRGRMAGLLVLALCLAGLGATSASAAEHYYRDGIRTRLAWPLRYLTEVPASATTHGGYIKVETDAEGRIVRTTFLWDGQPVDSDVLNYSGDARLPDHTRHFAAGVLTGVTAFTRDTDGQPTRVEFYTDQGVLTGYATNTFFSDHADGASFTPEGVRKARWQAYFSPDGAEIRRLTYFAEGDSYIEEQFDPTRGVEASMKKYVNGKVRIAYVDTYDADDDLIRRDMYNENNAWYGAEYYERNLQTKGLYKFSSGEIREIRYSYDPRRWATSTQQFEDGVLVCTFLFERFPNGTIKRTIAQGPDSSLWAEYPNLMVVEVNRSGHPPGSTAGVIYKVGDWWSPPPRAPVTPDPRPPTAGAPQSPAGSGP